ncbi:hypothetical protein [Sporolactobacillus laevolacticus]|uniref:Uncharacterized protein n=1 Tax=Sporolactobacillus laevolacticus DSM 442 TaxID=1395513 RepID=V6IZ03_9BACL|nr:hypothetical protein [Sporolactobacillus laevolacticus]EST12036.1 hypothetical protein P343_07880 [Sporolactobacillus laevolacticus DSM 442]
MSNKYLSVNDNQLPAFKDDEINQIIDTDIAISDDIYDQFFEQRAQGKQYKVKNVSGTTFEEIFEEYTPDPVKRGPTDVEISQQQNAQLLLQLAQQEQTIKDMQNQNAAIMLQLAQSQGGAS